MRSGNRVRFYSKKPFWSLSLLLVLFMMIGQAELSAFQQQEGREYFTKEETDTVKTEPVKKKKKVRRPFRPKFQKPEFNAVFSIFRYLPDENTESNINFKIGAEISTKLEKKLRVFTGVNFFYIDQNFPIGDERVQGRLANGALLARELISTDIRFYGLEFPIGVRYSFKDTPNSLNVAFGVTSVTSIYERYVDNIEWKMGGLVGSNFVATSTRSTTIANETTGPFPFFNFLNSGFIAFSKSFRVSENRSAELQLDYHFNLSNMINIFQDANYKKSETLGLTLKYPLEFR